MKVIQMRTTALSIPLNLPVGFMNAANPKTNPVIVQLKTDDGLEGFAITFANNDFQVNSLKASIDDLERLVIGQDIMPAAAIWTKLHAALKHTGQWGGYGLKAIGSIDIAFWDLRAKALNLPLAQLLGGFRSRVPAYASNALQGFLSIDELQTQAAELVKQGFRAMKLKIKGKKLEEDLERFKSVRQAVGNDIDILVEGNWTMTEYEAIRLGRALETYRPYWLEDPIGLHHGEISLEDTASLAQIAAALDVPVAAGETFSTKYGFRRIFESRAVDIAIVDVACAGGITEWMKIAALAEAYNIPVASHLFHDVSMHMVAAIPNGLVVEYMPFWDKIYKEPPKVIDGCFEISEKPGIGLELDPEILDKYRIA
jgi:L-alanine-DL-glutamate epimerase-like enolase superfamily enzyme